MLISTFFIIINKKNFKSPASATTLGGGVHMNDLAKILGIDGVKVNIKSIDDHVISFYIQMDGDQASFMP